MPVVGTAVVVERRAHVEFHQGDQVRERMRQPHVLHVLLEVGQAVLEGKAPVQRLGVERPVRIHVVTGDRPAHRPGQRERLQVFQRVGQVAKALPIIERRCVGAKRIDPHFRIARVAQVDLPRPPRR